MKSQNDLIDPVNKKTHFVVTDAQGMVIGAALKWLDLGPDSAIPPWAKLSARPSNVEKMAVVIANTPPVEDIPLVK